MSILDRYPSALQTAKFDVAVSALQTPGGRDSFEYGRVCGLVQGLQMALDMFNEMRSEKAGKDSKL